jgi:hypothetical protein
VRAGLLFRKKIPAASGDTDFPASAEAYLARFLPDAYAMLLLWPISLALTWLVQNTGQAALTARSNLTCRR